MVFQPNSDLAESRQQIADGKGLDMEDELNRIGKQQSAKKFS